MSDTQTPEELRRAREEYAERKQAKVDRFEGYAANAQARSATAYRTAHRIVDSIPLGQPIIVGHHSERRHRRDIERCHRNTQRSIDENDKAEHWARRAAAVEDDTSIHTDDPDAGNKLRAKIAELEARRDRIKAINRAHRTAKGDPVKLAAALAKMDPPGLTERETREIERVPTHQRPTHGGYPGYKLTNMGGNLRRYQQRLAGLDQAQARLTDGRWLWTKYAGKCEDCGQPIEKGTRALYVKTERAIYCEPCGEARDNPTA